MNKILLDRVDAFKEEAQKLLFRIQTDRSLDEKAYQQTEELAKEISVLLKPLPLLPKELLNEFRTIIRILRNEAPTFPEPGRLNALAERMEVVFDLILMGETPSDRKSGKPRIF